MSVQVQQIPHLFGWAKNRNSVRLHCNDIVSTGTTASFSFTFSSSAPSVGAKVVVTVDGRELAFTRANNATSAYEFTSVNNLGAKIKACPYVTAIFSTSYDSSNRTLQLTAREVGLHQVAIHTLSVDGFPDGYEATLVASSDNNNGSDKKRLDNYGIAVAVDVDVNANNSLHSYQGEAMVMRPDDDGNVEVTLDVLRGYTPEPDLPSSTGGQFQLLTNALMRYKVRYGEVYGSPVPLLQNMATTEVRYALCGEVAERFAQANLPDWKSGQNSRFVVDSNDTFWVIGEDTGLTCTTRFSSPVYIYGLWFDEHKGFGEELTVSVVATGKTLSGSEATAVRTFSAANGSVYRVMVAPADFGFASDVIMYSVKLSTSGGSWERVYRVLPDFYAPTTLLLQNKYGFLQPFSCGELIRNVSVEGDACTVNRRRYIDVSECFESYTAVMHYMTERQAKALSSCLGQRYHYVLDGRSWLRITLEPDTWKVRDDEEGMVAVQFNYRFVENQQENLATGTLSQGLSILVDDVWDSVAVETDRLSPNDNVLLN